MPRSRSGRGVARESVHLLLDSTGLKLCGADEWPVKKHGTKTRRSWRKLHIGMNAACPMAVCHHRPNRRGAS
jgi:hypothetical protein